MNAPVKIHGVRLPHLLAVRSDRAPTNRAMKMEAMEPAELMAPRAAVDSVAPMPRSARSRCGTSTDIVPKKATPESTAKHMKPAT